MKIYIHTYGRSQDQQTLHRLSPAVRKKTWLVVQHRERELYDYPRVIVLPDKIRRLSPTRQWLIENSDDSKIVLLDDDLAFYRRKAKTDWHLRYCEDKDIDDLFAMLDGWLSDVAHCGVSAREGNNRIEPLFTECSRMMRVLAYNLEVVRKVGARFDRIETKQDFDMTLQLLRGGYKNRVSYEFAQGQWRSSNALGGCSDYRTKEMMSRCAGELADLHPGFVKVVEKETKTAWKDFGGVRKDVMIQWKKAYESGQKTNSDRGPMRCIPDKGAASKSLRNRTLF